MLTITAEKKKRMIAFYKGKIRAFGRRKTELSETDEEEYRDALNQLVKYEEAEISN